ncbi:related to glycinamide ribonucleotide transformylase [Rhynchosporium graminicola]|uniref:Phosphoribosylglycinamide formyltransferase n=1 Tax=Rhynchosporium graminicola TaxID=2792576 RepID=A0A1E1KHM7_9HELO|nr:related to glycinamide ribonucleotide transformylase [Rhynchosporium commune]
MAQTMHDLPATRATVLISGEGSNLQALIDSTTTIMPYLKIVRVISNKAKANGLNRASKASIPTRYHNLVSGKYHAAGEKDASVKQAAREKYDADLAEIVLADSPDIVICAGWMHIVSPAFLEPLAERKVPIINLHPALPGMYDGIDAIKRAYDDYHKGRLENDETGIMIHYVIHEVDQGQPIVTRKIQCRKPETLEELNERVHAQEHELILEGTAMAIHNLWEDRKKGDSSR